MAQLLFWVHGMGHHPTGWEIDPLNTLREAAEQYGLRDRLEAEVTMHALSYDSVFRARLAGWDESVSALREGMDRDAGGGFSIPAWLQGVSEAEENFFWSHVVDVVLYRFFPQVATEVRTRVLRDFVAAVNAANAAGPPRPRVAIIAHSLGTSVAHDALAYLTTHPIDGSGAYLSETGWRLDHLFMLANVSRVLSRLTTPFYRSSVRCEGAPGDGLPALREYLSFAHSLDPIPMVRAFRPAGWGSRFSGAAVDQLLDWNVHGYGHYLRHPDVHVPILNRLLDFPITDDQHRAAVDGLEEVGRDACMEVVDRLRLQLRQARDLVEVAADEPESLVRVATQTYTLIDRARKECLGNGGGSQ
jgi:hypothetical protein